MSSRDDDISESLIVLRARHGDREAFSTLIDLYDRRLLYFVHRLLGEHDGALDVLQEVWLTVHRKLRSLDAPEAFRVWLYRIAHDQAVSELRRRLRRPVFADEIESLPDSEADSDLDGPAFENAERIHAALQTLSIDHRRVLTLKFLEDMAIDEIAKVTDCSAGTVKSRLHYAKLALRRQLEEHP